MNPLLQDLVEQLDLETLEDTLFRGQSRDLGGPQVFGGQVVGQALVAASRTVSAGRPHSLHAYFLRRGDARRPIVYEVDKVRDGRSFTTRRVQAIQYGEPILSMIASFHVEEPGEEHAFPMPAVPMPETLPPGRPPLGKWNNTPDEQLPLAARSLLDGQHALQFRYVPAETFSNPLQRAVWFRTVDALPDDALLHRGLLAYASDFHLLGTAFLPHGMSIFTGEDVIASIDHALWFHRELRVDDWLLYAMDTPSAQGARGYTRGQIFDRHGRLVASVAQEGLMRRGARRGPG